MNPERITIAALLLIIGALVLFGVRERESMHDQLRRYEIERAETLHRIAQIQLKYTALLAEIEAKKGKITPPDKTVNENKTKYNEKRIDIIGLPADMQVQHLAKWLSEADSLLR